MIKLPYYYENIAEIEALKNTLDLENSNKLKFIKEMQDNTSPLTAKDYGLKILGATYDTKAISSEILSKIQTNQVMSIPTFKTVIKNLLNVDTNVVIFENKGGVVNIGVYAPLSIKEIQHKINGIRSLLPAHLIFDIFINKLTWGMFDSMHKTYGEWDALHLTVEEFETYGIKIK